MVVSVIMVSYHTGPALWLAIDSVLEQPECKELLLVDNGNAPGDFKRLQALAAQEPRLQLLSGHGNVGFAKGCNLGAKQATGKYILLLNPDSMLPEGGLTRALVGLQSYPPSTVAGCFLAHADGSEQRGGRRALLTPENAVVESLGLHRFFKRSQRLNFHGTPMPDATHEVPAISGAFMLTTRAFYQQLRGLDESYFLHMEDMDFCYRVHQACGKIICIPDVKVIHFRSTSEVTSAFVEKHKASGFIRYLRTHFGKQHSPAFFMAMTLGIWLRYALKITLSTFDRLFTPPLAARHEIARVVLLHRLTRFVPNDNSLAGKTILVTGATGQAGLCTVAKALARGAHVIAAIHETDVTFSHPHLTWVDYGTISTIKADYIIHAAPLTLLAEVSAQFITNGMRRIITFSSAIVADLAHVTNTHEKDYLTRLQTAESDLLSITANTSCPATILRTTTVYGTGAGGELTRLADIIRRFGRIPVYGDAQGWRHPVQAVDLAEAALAILQNPKSYGKTYTLGGKQTMKCKTMIGKLFEYLGKPVRITSFPFLPSMLDALGAVYQMRYINGEMARRMNRDLVFDIKDAIDDFGYRPQGFLEGEAVL